MRLTTNMTGRPNSVANFQTRSVWTSTPETASRTMIAASAAYDGGARLGSEDAVPGSVQEVDPGVAMHRVGGSRG